MPAMPPSRDLLIALHALKRGWLDRTQLLEAWEEWSPQIEASMAEVLLRRGWVTPAQRDELESAVPAGTPRRHPVRRGRPWAWALAAVLLIALVGAGLAWWRPWGEDDSAGRDRTA